jgi:hypothetical protein
VQRLHPDAVHCRREPARLDNYLANHGHPLSLGRVPRTIVDRDRKRLDAWRAQHLAHLRRLLWREAAHVLRKVPQLLVGDQLVFYCFLE